MAKQNEQLSRKTIHRNLKMGKSHCLTLNTGPVVSRIRFVFEEFIITPESIYICATYYKGKHTG